VSKARPFVEEFRRWCRGDEAAVDFLAGVFGAVHLWDDLIDGDHERSEEEIHRVFFWLLCEMPRNPFFAAHSVFLTAQMQALVDQWLMANQLERSGDADLQARAYGLRDTSMGLCAQVAYLIGGYEHMRAVSEELIDLACTESLSEYRAGLRAE